MKEWRGLGLGLGLVLALWAPAGGESVFHRLFISHSARMPFYIHSEKATRFHFSPSGWMGDVEDISISGSYENCPPNGGPSSLRVSYAARGELGWAGICWQHPANNWGQIPKEGFNLSKAEELAFWARGEKGGETLAEIQVGGIAGAHPDSDGIWAGPIKLGKGWERHVIDLAGRDLRRVIGAFCFIVRRQDNPQGCTLYLDEIAFE